MAKPACWAQALARRPDAMLGNLFMAFVAAVAIRDASSPWSPAWCWRGESADGARPVASA